MRKLVMLTIVFLMLSGVSLATWEDAAVRGLVPYWQAAEDWYTFLVFVNGSESDYELIYVRFCDRQGNFCSSVFADMFSIRPSEQLLICSKEGIGYPMLLTASCGYIKFRLENGAPIQVYALIYNELTSTGSDVPVFNQEHGF
ncbi:hypothetical protein J7M28_07625 [bacterium]|nr:hypothetical protein [bacterium]